MFHNNAPVFHNNAPALLTNVPALLTNAPVFHNNTPAFHNNAPALLTNVPVFHNNAPVLLDNAPVLLTNTGLPRIRSATMSAFTLGAFALRLAIAFRTWHDPTHGAALTYFGGNRARHGGDELRLCASLIKDHLLAQGSRTLNLGLQAKLFC